MKRYNVVAAVICDSINEKKKVFATEKGYGEFEGWWEFPGGKIEKGETPQQALIREIKEELNVELRIGDLIRTIEYDYSSFHLSMECYWCELLGEEVTLLEAKSAKWLTKEELFDIKWLPADKEIIDTIKKQMK